MKLINEHSDAIFFYAENNGISYDYEDIEDVVFISFLSEFIMRLVCEDRAHFSFLGYLEPHQTL